MPDYLRPYVRYLVRLALWGVDGERHHRAHGRREWLADRCSHGLFGDRIAKELLDRGLMIPWGTMRNGEPAYVPTQAARHV